MPKPYHGKKNKIKFHANSSQILRDAFVIGHNTKKPPMRHALRAPKLFSYIYFMYTMKTNQYNTASCILRAILFSPAIISALRSSLGLRMPMAYWRITEGLTPISRATPAILMKQ